MINRQMRSVTVLKNTQKRDEYGYKTNGFESLKCVDAAIMLYQQNNTSDVRYSDVTHICLCRDKDLTDDMRIKDGDILYDIVLVNNGSRLSQLFLKEVRR